MPETLTFKGYAKEAIAQRLKAAEATLNLAGAHPSMAPLYHDTVRADLSEVASLLTYHKRVLGPVFHQTLLDQHNVLLHRLNNRKKA
jgi:hypothetical protein